MKNISVFAVTIMLSAGAFAQAPTHTQVLNNADTQRRESVDADSVHKGQKQYFKSLDRNQKGYLSNDDVSADAFLAANYGKCDSDHDGKLTWIEFKTCTRDNDNQPPNP